MIEWKNFDSLESYGELAKAERVKLAEVMSGESGAERVKAYSVPMAAGMVYNYAAKQVDENVLAVLKKLAKEAQLSEKYKALYNGEMINTGEKRLVLHQLTRGQLGDKVVADGTDKRAFYVEQQERIAEFAKKVHSGEITNAAGEKFTTVVQIGIGGSDLGPRAMYLALENWAKKHNTFKMEAKFISNVDPDDAAAVLGSIDVAHSMFVLVSKSGTTLETLTNESFVKDALKKAGLDASKHMVAVTSETSPLAKSDDYLAAFFMDDYIGGRFSSTSAVGGAVLSLAFGPEVFAQFLEGAAEEDKLAAKEDLLQNPDMLDALIGVYERNMLGYPATAVLPYSQALSRFPAHLQQADMESNGKSVNRFGEPVNYVTGPVLFGEPGTNGQHSFYQLLHQGTDIVPIQFVGFKTVSYTHLDVYKRQDNTPGFERNARLKPEEKNAYLAGMGELFRTMTIGYGVWTYRDYGDNKLYNPQFALGLRGWKVTGESYIEEGKNGKEAVLPSGSSISQEMRGRVTGRTGPDVHVRFSLEGTAGSTVSVRVGKRTKTFQAGERTDAELVFENALAEELTISCTGGGSVRIDDLNLYTFVTEGDIYRMDGSEGECTDGIRQLNQALGAED